MAWLKTSLAAAVLAALAACGGGGTDTRAASGSPCARCKYGVSDQKASPPAVYCMVEGKKVDCRKNPAECPECAKAMMK